MLELTETKVHEALENTFAHVGRSCRWAESHCARDGC